MLSKSAAPGYYKEKAGQPPESVAPYSGGLREALRRKAPKTNAWRREDPVELDRCVRSRSLALMRFQLLRRRTLNEEDLRDEFAVDI
jgi:hypothetical protein